MNKKQNLILIRNILYIAKCTFKNKFNLNKGDEPGVEILFCPMIKLPNGDETLVTHSDYEHEKPHWYDVIIRKYPLPELVMHDDYYLFEFENLSETQALAKAEYFQSLTNAEITYL